MNTFQSQTDAKMHMGLTMQERKLVTLFPNLRSLGISQHGEAAAEELRWRFEDLTALTRLSTLKVQWDRRCSDSLQVPCRNSAKQHDWTPVYASLSLCGAD